MSYVIVALVFTVVGIVIDHFGAKLPLVNELEARAERAEVYIQNLIASLKSDNKPVTTQDPKTPGV